MIFICLGAALFTMHSISIGVTRDQARIAAAIVSGVGFLGGGAILRGSGTTIQGLTTAATIWLTSALGMGIGAGYYYQTACSASAVLVVLWLFPFIERWIDGLKTSVTYEVIVSLDGTGAGEAEAILNDAGLSVHPKIQHKRGDELACSWFVTGSPDGHRKAVAKLLKLPSIQQLKY
jgi:putative Mg2+ transporter-C (MgtC) family protein